MAKNNSNSYLTQKDFYETLNSIRRDFELNLKDLNSSIKSVEDKVDKTQQDVATINGKNQTMTFFVSSAIGIFFSVVNLILRK